MLNEGTLIGRLGADPEIRSMPNGGNVANMRVAVNEWRKSGDGEGKEETSWFTVEAFGKNADFAEKYLSKGRLILAKGSMRLRDYEDKEGNKRMAFSLRAQLLKGLDKGNRDGAADSVIGKEEDIPF